MQSLVDKYKPTILADFAGLDRPRAILSHLAEHPYSSAWLLLGPSGLGKTTMAFAVAERIGGQVYHIPAKSCDLATVEEIAMKCHYRPMIGNWNIVICDEADQMSRAAQLAFLSILDSTAAPPDTIFLFTGNDTKLLADRFLSRCRTVNFTLDGLLEPAAKLLARIWTAETEAPALDFRAVMRQADFNIRQAIMTIEMEIIAASAAFSAVEAPPPSIATGDARLQAQRLRREGMSLSAIARQLNAPQSSIWRWTRVATN